jgi:hypothetical protein
MDSTNSAAQDKLVFPRVRRNAVLYLGLSAGVVVVAVAVWCIADRQRQYDPSHLKTIAVVGGCLFTLLAIYNVFEILDDTPELVIDSAGIIDNMGSAPKGRIPWQDVTGVRSFVFGRLRFVVIDVVDHQKYIERSGRFMRGASEMATELAGSPIAFSGDSIGLASEELLRILNGAFQKYARQTAIVTPAPLVSAPVPQEQTIQRISKDETERIRRAVKRMDRLAIAAVGLAVAILVVGHGVAALWIPPPQLVRMQSRVEGLACAVLMVTCLALTARFLLESYSVRRMDVGTLRNTVHLAIGAAIPIAILVGGAIAFGVTAVQLWLRP